MRSWSKGRPAGLCGFARTSRSRRSFRGRLESLEVRLALSGMGVHDDHDHVISVIETVDPSGNEICLLGPIAADLDHLEDELGGTASGTGGGGTVALAPDLSQTFLLHSLPGATKRIFLDFNGHTTTGTFWNSSYSGGAPIVTPAYDFDGNTASFSTAELERIQYIWQRVSEDFLPFNVDVTTEDPGVAALTNTGGGDAEYGIRVAIGGNSNWLGAQAGGVAYVGSFTWNSDTPTFVFEENLGNGHEKYTAEAISHEVGHTLGLSHDGRTTPAEGYYQGQGSGPTGWAPIMGVGYYRELVQWSKGEYANANNKEDDLAIMTSQNGFGYRPDDFGSSIATASPLVVAGSSIATGGIIERTTDLDTFSVVVGAGTISLNALPFDRSPNLDILLELYDGSSQLVASANPTGSLSAAISNLTVAAGLYYVQISGVGEGSPTSTGYSDYASIGRYTLTGSIVPPSSDVVSISANTPSKLEGNSGATPFTFTVSRLGTATTATTVTYAFDAGTTDASDFVGGLPSGGTLDFAAGETSRTVTISVQGDLAFEPNETFSVRLVSATAPTTIGTGSASSTIQNDDAAPAITVSPTSGLRTSENRTTASFTVVLTTQPLANVTIAVASLDTTEGTVSTSQLTFTPTNWNTAQVVVVTGVDDTIRDGDIVYSVQLAPAVSGDPNYNGIDPADVSVTNLDNEKGGRPKQWATEPVRLGGLAFGAAIPGQGSIAVALAPAIGAGNASTTPFDVALGAVDQILETFGSTLAKRNGSRR